MAQVDRANVAANLNTGPAWTGGVVPTATDIAAWGTPLITIGTAQALGGSVSWQGVLLRSAQTSAITIAATAGATLTLGTSGIDLSASGANLTVASLVALGPATQTWSVASGRTLTVSGQLTANAKNVTLSSAGSFSLTGANTTTWTNSTITVASGAYWNIANANGPGAASNSIVVEAGASATIASTVGGLLPASFTLSGTGTGTAATRFALHANVAQGAGRTFTFAGTRTMFLSMNSLNAATHAAKFTGTTSAETVLVAGQNTTLTNTANDFVAGGNGVELQSYQTNGTLDGRYYLVLSGDISDTAVFGNAANSVYIESSGAFQTTSATTTRTISRNFKIDGHNSTLGTPASDISNNSTTRLQLSGTVNLLGTGGFPATFNSATGGLVALTGTLTGAGGISVAAGGTLELASSLTLSSYTGNVSVAAASTLKYGIGGITGTLTMASSAIIDNPTASLVTLSHSSYSTGNSFTFTGSSGDLSTGSGAFTGPLNNITVSAARLTIPKNMTTNPLTKSGNGTLALAGNNSINGFTLSAGTLELNSAGSAGTGNFTFAATGTSIDSTAGATLTQSGSVNLGAVGGFTWKGTADLTFGSGSVSHTGSRTVTFVNGATGKLTFSGPLSATTATYLWNVGNSVAGAKNVLYFANTNASLATTGQVTAGYLRAGNATSLGSESVVGSVTWTVSSGAAIELINGITVSAKKNFNGVGTGPNLDGALRSVSGVNKWQGAITVSTVTGARIQVDAGTFTLDNTTYTGMDATSASTPVTFTAQSSAVLNQDRVIAANFSTVTIGNGSGTVVLSKANLHSGAMTCSAGTTKLTNIAAVGAGAGNSVTVTAAATIESAVKAVFPATLTLGNSGTPAIFKISA